MGNLLGRRPSRLITWSRLCLVASAVASFSAYAGDRTATVPGQVNAAKIYQNYCSVCHGDRGDGKSRAQNSLNPSPRNFTSTESAAELTRERMIYSVTNGRPGTAMQPWKVKLRPDEIEAVVDHIRATFMQTGPANPAAAKPESAPAPQSKAAPATPAAPANMAAPFPKGLVGNADKGQQIYMSTCVSCHGPKGGGDGPRAYFIFPKPRNFTLPESKAAYNRPALFEAISKGKAGTVMPAWGKVLSDQDIANVGEFVFRTFIRS
ncbi:MAG: c-type cytochrome [Pseudomonadota bacterium]